MLQINTLDKLHLGIQGENKATTIRIDMSEWAAEYPDAVFSVVFKPHESTLVYPMATEYDEETKVLSWEITSAVTATPGDSRTEIRAQDSETGLVKKTRTILSFVVPCIGGTESDPPEPQEDWVTQVLNAAADAEDSAEDAEAYAIGKRGGTDVESSDPTYHNNSKYYSEQASDSATASGNAKTAAETAQGKAEDAQTAAETAQGKAEDAQTAAETAQGKAEDALTKNPKIDPVSGNWMRWNSASEQWEDTGTHAQGEQGIQAYLHIKYAASEPTQDSDMKNTTDAWIGIYSGTASTAPAHYTDYTWYRMKGEDGDEAYIHIKYSANEPTQDSDMKTTPDAWIGVCGGTSSTAPTHYTDYTWYKFKGETGATGIGMPTGGSAGDVLVKRSGTDYDYEWSDEVLHPVVNVSMTIPVNGWSNSSPYTYTWTDSRVTATSDVEVEYLSGAEDADGDYIEYEKVSGGIEFTSPTKPTTGIPVAITIKRAKNESITEVDGSMVETDVITGAENVDEALGVLDNDIGSLADHIAMTVLEGNNDHIISIMRLNGFYWLHVEQFVEVSNGTTIYTLTSTYRPTSQRGGRFFYKQQSGYGVVLCNVKTSGAITLDAQTYNEPVAGIFDVFWPAS